MTDLEISKALALAIGWPESSMQVSALNNLYLLVADPASRFRAFDYRDWNVISPIAERYDCFPKYLNYVTAYAKWCAQKKIGEGMRWMAETPQKAIALAVIGAKK